MLQSTEYRPLPYLRWWWRTRNFSTVAHRRKLDDTKSAHLLLAILTAGIIAQFVLGVYFLTNNFLIGAIIILLTPLLWAQLIVVPLELGRVLLVAPRQQRLIAESKRIFASHTGIKIAIAGSYGKTSMKELLTTVLAEGKHVVATPGNKNVAISHAYFAQRLQGDEDVVIVEFGEGKPGDVATFTDIVRPTHAIVTGIAPAHLDTYKSLQQVGEDIFTVTDHVPAGQAYVNGVSNSTKPFLRSTNVLYDQTGVLGYAVSHVAVSLETTSFTLKKGKRILNLSSKLIGRHHIAPLALVAALALEFGLTPSQVEAGIAKTRPYEHRMQPYRLSGAWVIDDSYNGNIEGIRAGTSLLAELPAKRKIYVTPGLVEQGTETQTIHEEIGRLIAAAQPDIVVLMANSTTSHIQAGLSAANYKGEVRVEQNPLHYYQNLEHHVAAGDIVLLQNDWTDNYA